VSGLSIASKVIADTAVRRTVLAATLVLAATGCVTNPATTALKLAIPAFSQDSVTQDSTGRKLGALAGVVLDSASRSGIGGAQVVLRSPNLSSPRFAYTNEGGGFVIGKLQPGRYNVLVRRLGYLPFNGPRDINAGVVDTVTVRIAASNAILQ
jgi:hypothetical protein